MSHEQEYIEIFGQNRALIEKPCAALLNAARAGAADRFAAMGFPGAKSEDWLHSNVAKRFATDYGINLGRVEVKADMHTIFTCDVPNLKTRQAYIVNDTFKNGENSKELPEGVILAGLNAEGQTVVNNIHHVKRGYLDFDGKLSALGADVKIQN